MWSEPKVDWKSSDKINYEDYNRIIGNINYVRELALEVYKDFNMTYLGNEVDNRMKFPYAEEYDNIEQALDDIRNNTFYFFTSSRGRWYENQHTPTYEDLNRIENACLLLKNGLESQKKCKKRLAFTLGRPAIF